MASGRASAAIARPWVLRRASRAGQGRVKAPDSIRRSRLIATPMVTQAADRPRTALAAAAALAEAVIAEGAAELAVAGTAMVLAATPNSSPTILTPRFPLLVWSVHRACVPVEREMVRGMDQA